MVMDSYIDNNENNNNVINHKNETNQIIYDLIKQNKNEKLKKFLRNNNNRNEIIIDNNLYKIAIKSNNFNSFELLNEYDTKENFKFLIENNPFILNYIFQNEVTLSKVTEQIASLYDYKKTCPKKLKNILRNELTIQLSVSFIETLLKLKKINFLNFILENYIFDNKFILNLLFYYKNRQIISNNEINKLIKKEKFKIPWKDLLYHCFSGVDLDYCYYYSDEELNEIKLLMKYLNQYNISLNLNEKDQNGNYPLLLACQKENIEVVNLLFDYSNKNNIVLEMNEKNKKENFPLLACLSIGCDSSIKLIKLLINYANKNNIILKINDKNEDGDYPLLNAIKNWEGKIGLIQLLMKYANKNNIVLKINDKNNEGDYPFLCACWGCFKESVKLIRLLMDYADKNNFILRINDKNENGDYPILSISMSYSDGYYIGSTKKDIKSEKIEVLIDYANKKNIILEINEKNRYDYPIWTSIINHETIMTKKLLFDYANQNNIVLDINSKNFYEDNSNETFCYPLLYSIGDNETETVKLIFDHANKNNIILDINNNGTIWYKFCDSPLLLAIHMDNIEIVQMLIDYAKNNNIILKIIGNGKSLEEFLYNCYSEDEDEDEDEDKDKDKDKGENENENENENIKGEYWERYFDSPLLNNTHKNSVEIIKLLVEYTISINNIKMINTLLTYYNKNNIVININEKGKDNQSLLLFTINTNNTELVKLLIDYADKMKIILEINEKDKEGNNIFLSTAIQHNNNEIIQLLTNYANEKNIIFD
ncbi:hypothetical protein BCR32DRAFT_247606 [Anaeromyces robustus]|uniref:Uncharacterized protein n=1 Tax=Anaeromyces robustus TaxID=1754192 RepID=A0A1Y1WWZ3_9FUNG|nr:hypothetical protein BCR32DRAFT_247606 [Anaeromyces robustus]|eukprot:ORX77848.1 hypothetical protein BCR32DRAFT_247606 [Anaeromyces robustus]